MVRDEEGFDYPRVNESRCRDCGRCIEVCPVIDAPNASGHGRRPAAYASWHRDEQVRAASSSGGAFSALAEQVLDRGGIVFGAAFSQDFMGVQHVAAKTRDDLARLRGSKYVQSSTVDAFAQACTELANGRQVLFSGTPCQIAGLRKLVGARNGQLLTCDLVCHGVPSPGVFADYMVEQCQRHQAPTTEYNFRDKAHGWNFPRVRQVFDNGREYGRWDWGDAFTHGFLLNTLLRPSCYTCRFTGFPRVADITLGDYWGVGTRYPQYNDNRGTSLVLANTNAGDGLLQACATRLFSAECDLDHAASHNSYLTKPAAVPRARAVFFDAYRSGESFKVAARSYIRATALLRRACTRIVRRLVWSILGTDLRELFHGLRTRRR